MSWKGVITNAGQQILSQWTANGHTLTIDGASVGSGYVDDIKMRVATALAHEEATAAIVSADAVDRGTKFKVQVSPAESTEYVAHEIGLWGHIDDGPRTLIALHQDSQTGINIPTKASSPDFIFALYLVHAISNSDTLTVNIDTSAVVSKSTMDNAIATAVSDASKTLNDKIVSNSEAISTNTNNISKNTADITALNNDLTNKLNISDEIFRTFDNTTYDNNANWACYTGIYTTNPNTVGAPDYGVLVVFAMPYPLAGFNGKNWIHQLWFSNNNFVEHRFSVNKKDGTGWSEWTKL